MNKLVKWLDRDVKIRASLADAFFGGAALVLNLFLATIGTNKYIQIGYGNTFGVTPQTFPRVIFICASILGALLLVNSLKKYKKQQEGEKIISFHLISVAILADTIFFVATMKTLGYPISNIIMMIGMYWLSGGKSWKSCLIMSFAFTVCSVLFFYTYLNLSIPMGILSFIIN